MTTHADPWELACLEQIAASLADHADFLARAGQHEVTVRLEGERPSTRLVIDWYDDRAHGRRSLDICLWDEFPDAPPEEVERSVVLSVAEA